MSRSTLHPLSLSAWMCLALIGWLVPLTQAGEDKKPTLPVGKIGKKLPPPPPAFDKAAPENLADLKVIQEHVKAVVDHVIPATVCVRIGAGSGSGVIISEDGYILTAAHVSGPAGRDVTVILHDGKQVKGKTLGANRGIDSGLIKITTPGVWYHVEMGNSAAVKKGDWCIATGHPGGYKQGRTPVVRLGKILGTTKGAIRSDCTLVGGDSGGPLFDIHGRVIGIHSRIGGTIDANLHVPVDTYKETWEKLAAGEVWGSGLGGPGVAQAWLGIKGDLDANGCKVSEVTAGSPADKAGLKVDDIITKFGDKKIENFQQLVEMVSRSKIGQRVTLEVRRGEETLRLEVTLAKRPK